MRLSAILNILIFININPLLLVWKIPVCENLKFNSKIFNIINWNL